MNISKENNCSEINTVSYVVTVYNKESFLTSTIESIVRQTGPFNKEIVFVDDASTDGSLELIEKFTEAHKETLEVKIVKNDKNCGPAIRLNQGCNYATGKYLHLMDSDDVLVEGATELMLTELIKERADFCYGHYKKTDSSQTELLERKLEIINQKDVTEDPLNYVLENKVVRMGQLITKDIFEKSGGCDERLFIQDESLPLRMAVHANRAVFIKTTVIYSPKKTLSSLSINTQQQQHDKFFAYNFAYNDYALPRQKKQKILAIAVSSLWKAYKKQNKFNLDILALYLLSKIAPNLLKKELLKSYSPFMLSMSQVRRTDVFTAS